MENEGSRKRKRELDIDLPRIKYHVQQSGRAFERLLKENSREELCEVVRKKLNLHAKIPLELVQIREGVKYDLEDDDDFEALKSAAYAYSVLDIQVSYPADFHAQSGNPSKPVVPLKKTKKQVSIVPPEEIGRSTKPKSSISDVINQIVETNRVDPSDDIVERPKKRRRGNQSNTPLEDFPSPDKAPSTSKRKTIKVAVDTTGAITQTSVATEGEKGPPKKKQKTKEKAKEKKPVLNEAISISTVAAKSSEQVEAPPKASSSVKPKSTKGKSKKVASEDATPEVSVEVPVLPKERSKKAIKNTETHLGAPVDAKETGKTETVTAKPVPIPTPGQNGSSLRVSTSTFAEIPPPDRPNITYAELKSRRLAEALAASTSASSSTPPQVTVLPITSPALATSVVKLKSKARSSAVSKEAQDLAEPAKPDTTKKPKDSGNATTKNFNGIPSKAKEAIKPTKNGSVNKPPVDPGKDRPSTKPGQGDTSTNEEEDEENIPVNASSKNQASASIKRSLSSKATKSSTITPAPSLSALTGKKKSEKSTVVRQNLCELCHGSYHFKHLCPVITSGIESISKRLGELRAEGGNRSLIMELEVWEKKEREKAEKDKSVSMKSSTPAAKANQKTPSSSKASTVRGWPPVVPAKSKLSEVAVESHEDGSESDTSSSDGEGAVLRSRSSSESSSSSETESTSTGIDLANVDLEALFRGPSLKAAVANLSRLEEEEAKETPVETGDGDIEMNGVLEEEDEEPVSKRPRTSFTAMARSSSPETNFVDDDNDSEEPTVMDPDQNKEIPKPSEIHVSEEMESSLPDTPANQDETESSEYIEKTSNVSEDKESVSPSPQVDATIKPTVNDGVVQTEDSTSRFPLTNISPDVTVESTNIIQGITGATSEISLLKIPPQAIDITLSKEKKSHQPPSTTPTAVSPLRSNIPRMPSPDVPRTPSPRINPTTPRTVNKMRDRHGNLPLGPPVSEVGMAQLVVLQAEPRTPTSNVAKDASPEKRKGGQPPIRGNLQPQTTRGRSVTVPPSGDDEPGASQGGLKRRGRPPLSEAVKAERQARLPSRGNSQPRTTRARSVTLPPSGDDEPSASQGGLKRRGRPPLSEAVKAERQALKDAMKEAKVAEKRVKREQAGLKTRKKSIAPTSEGGTSSIQQTPSSSFQPSSISTMAPPVNVTPFPGSQWQTLPPVPSSVASSSPAVDELIPSSQSMTKPAFPMKSYLHRDHAGFKSPNSTTGVDESDVEKLVGTLETGRTTIPFNATSSTRQPLFLPGASQMTQSQSIPHFVGSPLSGMFQDSVSLDAVEGGGGEHKASTSGSGTESDIEAPAIISLTAPTKSAFPSLSQLKFDKFRPSFLMRKAMFSHTEVPKKDKEKEEPPQADEDSDSDDDGSSDEDLQSHIPKDKRAGTGVVKRKTSRGLLQA